MWINIRVAFIGYRNVYHSTPYEIVKFTEDLQTLQAKLLGIKASGGEGCKNLNDVYHHAYKLDWCSNNKLIIHVGDSPNHGIKYHEKNYPDIFPLKDDHHFPLELHVKRMARDGFYLYLFKLNNHTDKTFEIIQNTYMMNCIHDQRFAIRDLVINPGMFDELIKRSIHELFYRAS